MHTNNDWPEFKARCIHRIGPERWQILSQLYSFLAAFETGMTPQQAIEEALDWTSDKP